jgi:CBS domain containing-hemolysin-like protein
VIPALVILLLVGITAFYVAAEFAAVSVRTSRVEQEAEGGSRLARRLLPHLVDARSLDRYIAACQIGITITSLVVGAYAQATLAPRLIPLFQRLGTLDAAAAQSTAAIVILVALTVFSMVIGELVPKSLALQAPTKVALWTVIPMQWSLRLMSWFIDWLNGAGTAILRLMRMPQSGHRHVHSAEEIAFLVTESGKVGLLKPNEQVRLRHALQLGDRPVRELMVPRTSIVALDVDTPMSEVIRVSVEEPFTRFPVYEDSIDQIIGVVHVRDVARVTARAGAPATLRDIMRPVLVTPASMRIDRVLVRLKEERRTMAVLVDEFGGTAGLITVDNILDDLIGDIGDEFRKPAPRSERLADGRFRLPASMSLDAAAACTRVRWDHDAATVGGVVTSVLGRIPKPGETLTIQGVLIEVESVGRMSIKSVIATPASGRAHA